MEKKSIEDLFKDSFEDFEAEVNPSVWSNVKTGLKGIGLGFLGKSILNKIGTNTLVAIVSSAATVVGTVAVMHWTGNAVKSTEQAKTVTAPTIVEKSIVEKAIETKEEKPLTLKEEAKPSVTVVNDEPMKETKIVVEPFHKDKKKIQSVINTYSKSTVSNVFASPVGGSVPLIINLSNTGMGINNRWKFGDGTKEEKGDNPVHVYITPGIYTITLISTDANGNIAIDSTQKIEVTGNSSLVATPRELTPNGDGVNDVFSFNGKNIIKMSGQIFDKKGNIIFECDKVGDKWEGKNRNGDDAKEGLYYYYMTAEGKDGKKYDQKGYIKLTR